LQLHIEDSSRETRGQKLGETRRQTDELHPSRETRKFGTVILPERIVTGEWGVGHTAMVRSNFGRATNPAKLKTAKHFHMRPIL
jgi:hypothetical protein